MRAARSSSWLLLLTILALVAAGCGGDDGGGGGGGGGSSSASGNAEEEAEPLDEDEFVEQVSEICTESEEEVLEIQEEADIQPGDFEESAEASGEIIESLEASLEGLEAITPPDDLAEDYETLLATVEEDFIGSVEDLQAAAEEEDEDAFTDAQEELDDVKADITDLEEDLGIECGEGDASEDLSDDLSSDFSSDFSDDLSSDFSDDAGTAVEPAVAIPEYGSVGVLDDAADACFGGDFETCDQLYIQADPGTGYRDYGDSCAGRQAVGTGVLCVDAFG